MRKADFINKRIILLLAVVFPILAASEQGRVSQAIAKEAGGMKKIAMIIAENNFRDEELFQPKGIFEKNGMQVKIACASMRQANGALGGTIKPDMLVADINPDDFDAIIFVGGGGASQYWDDAVSNKLAQDALKGNKVIAAICIAPVTLARAGILKGRRATVWSSEAGQLKAGGATYTASGVERDGNVITASGPDYARKFGQEIVKALAQ